MTLSTLIIRRLLVGFIILLVVSVLVFIGTEILPGDVAHAILGQGATPELVVNIRERLGLNEPSYIRYFQWLGQLLSGHLGNSLINQESISDLVANRIGNTFLLAGTTAIFAVPLSICLGLLSALKPNGLIDRTISGISLALISIPDFLVAIILVSIFSVYLGWLPSIANLSVNSEFSDVVRILILPVSALVFSILAHMVRMTRTAVLNVLSSPAIEMAMLKGVSRWRILIIHALPNAISPIVNVVALNLAYLISGVVVVETLFNFAGLGRLTVDAVVTRDIPVLQVCAMIFCTIYVVLNLIADIISIFANPRLRYPR